MTRSAVITEGAIIRPLLYFFFPILLGTFFQQLYNTVDALIVGNFLGKEALAAVGGTTSTYLNLFVGFFVGLSSGATVLISSHILGELSKLATHYGFIDGGRMVREVSAEELARNGRKCVRLTVTDVPVLARVLDEEGLEYKVLSDEQADVFGSPNLTRLALALNEAGCEVRSAQEKDESLESYFLSLVGGERHE